MTWFTFIKYVIFLIICSAIGICSARRELEVRDLRDKVHADSLNIEIYKRDYKKKNKFDI